MVTHYPNLLSKYGLTIFLTGLDLVAIFPDNYYEKLAENRKWAYLRQYTPILKQKIIVIVDLKHNIYEKIALDDRKFKLMAHASRP